MNYIEKDRKFIAQTYGRQPLALVEGKGARVRDSEGREYIDCFGGIGVLNVGHCHPKVTRAIREQCRRIMHTSNLYYVLPQVELAELLYQISGGYRSFFCNSGAEANEAAIKLVRKYTGKSGIIAAKNSFHGRTIATLSATGQDRYKKGFEPLCREFAHVEFGESKVLEKRINSSTAAVMLEPIQGEGGVVVPPDGYLKEVRELCDENEILLVFDEVQTGFGRTGEMFAWQVFEVKPDIFTVAKALGGGFPIGAMLAKPEVMEAFEKGDHATTFGGNHLACAAAKAAIEVIREENLVKKSKELGSYMKGKLEDLKRKYQVIKDVRGYGLMIGVELSIDGNEVVAEARRRGVLLNCTGENVIRFIPPLVIEKEDIDRVLRVFDKIIGERK